MKPLLPLDQMTVEEKLDLIETLWADLSRHPDRVPSPAWHEEVLKDREAAAKDQSQFMDLDEAERKLRDLMK